MFFSSFAPAAFLALALAPQAALGFFNFVTFSNALQCAPFSVQFSGGQPPTAWPLKLTVVPLNATPISIDLPNSVWNETTETGHAITFLPLREGTFFIASLDDANGVSAGLVSDVIKVEPFNDTSCLRQTEHAESALYALSGGLSQLDAAPSIRAFIPKGASFTVNQSSANAALGTASYIMDAFHGSEVALLLNDSHGHEATSNLLSVGGNSESSGTCIPSFSYSSNSTSATNTTAYTSSSSTTNTTTYTSSSSTTVTASMRDTMSRSSSLSQGAIIAIAAASGSIVVVIVLAMSIWIICWRRKMQQQISAPAEAERGTYDYPAAPPEDEKRAPPQAGTSHAAMFSWDSNAQTAWSRTSKAADDATGEQYIRNPLYTSSQLWLTSPTASSSPTSARRSAPSTTPSSGSRSGSARSSKRETSLRSAMFSSLVNTPAPTAPSPARLADAPGGRKTPQTALSPSTSLSRRGSQRNLPSSPTTTISTVDIEHFRDMAERYAPAAADAGPPLPTSPRGARDAVRTSAYLAGVESLSLRSPPSVRVRPPSLLLRSGAGSATSSMYSLHVGSPSGHRPALSTHIHRDPPQARVPSSPMPSPLPSPL
ncbi:hypothetical protein WOLCODRAFT_142751 [Wolfiporia cocos MD-104 SS10]|uniref:Mid2 domain-containing protein n=1 Tax=Wolfiporia cocos (strain MD-104) TaxID=742152 RepID=A0A2H3JBV7_WOLCO|nr:hypothetical protein WOLCODRAFT_142751 [Wolfiporia cocos MD-104 SS10]